MNLSINEVITLKMADKQNELLLLRDTIVKERDKLNEEIDVMVVGAKQNLKDAIKDIIDPGIKALKELFEQKLFKFCRIVRVPLAKATFFYDIEKTVNKYISDNMLRTGTPPLDEIVVVVTAGSPNYNNIFVYSIPPTATFKKIFKKIKEKTEESRQKRSMIKAIEEDIRTLPSKRLQLEAEVIKSTLKLNGHEIIVKGAEYEKLLPVTTKS